MKRSRMGTILPIMSAAMLLAACSGGASSTTPSVPGSTGTDTNTSIPGTDEYQPYFTDKDVNITLWTTAGETAQTILDDYIAKFNELEPRIKITNNKISGSYDDLKNQIITGFSSDSYPDIAYCYPDHVAEYLYYGKAAKLDDYINDPVYGWSAEDLEDIVPAFIEEGQQYSAEGTYSVPFSKSTEAMFYNPIIIGLDLSDYDKTIGDNGTITEDYINNITWEEMFEHLAPALKKYNDAQPAETKIYDSTDENSAIIGYDSDDNLFITLAKQYGYDYTSIDPITGKGKIGFVNDGMKSLMKMLNKAAVDKLFITKGKTGDYVNTLFTERKVLFSIGSTGGITYQYSDAAKFVPSVAGVPQAGTENPTKAVMSQGPSMVVLTHPIGGGNSAVDKDRIMASWLFYRFMVNEENSTRWALNSTGYMPLRYSCYESAAYTNAATETGKDGLELLIARGMKYYQTASDEMFTSPVFIGSSECRNQAGSIVTQVMQEATYITDEKLNSIFNTAYNEALAQIK